MQYTYIKKGSKTISADVKKLALLERKVYPTNIVYGYSGFYHDIMYVNSQVLILDNREYFSYIIWESNYPSIYISDIATNNPFLVFYLFKKYLLTLHDEYGESIFNINFSADCLMSSYKRIIKKMDESNYITIKNCYIEFDDYFNGLLADVKFVLTERILKFI